MDPASSTSSTTDSLLREMPVGKASEGPSVLRYRARILCKGAWLQESRIEERMTTPRQQPGRSPQDYRTPRGFLKAVTRRLGVEKFALDVAAHEANAVSLAWLGPGSEHAEDALTTPWRGRWGVDEWAWLNPPFADIAPWAKKCWEESHQRARIALLVPASVGSNWFRDWVDRKAKVLFLNGRLAFIPDRPRWLYPKDCILCLYGEPPGYEVWRWKDAL